ncbi:elastin [Archangium lansingense]|uniref:elastin n=1 Tax=Archangium lansingense TaxID=2995310 RepID=UPI003B7C8B1E
MAGFLSSFVLTGLLAAGPGAFSFDGPEVSARTTGNVGFFTQGAVPFTDLFERGTGSVELSVRDRIADPRATYGDAGSLVATFDLGGDSYRVELDQAGFPPAQARNGLPEMGPLPGAPAQPIAGGVVLDQDMHGGAMLGSYNTSRVHAAAAVWGVGRVWRNGELLTDTAVIHASALAQGAHADDGTFRTLPVARPGDTELTVLVWNLPREAEPRGFIQFDFDDVAITVNGNDVPAVAVVPTAGTVAGVAPPTSPVPGGTSLGAVPNSALSQQQGVGGSGVVVTGQTGTDAVDGLSDPVRTQQLAPVADTTLPGPASLQGGVIDPFLNPGRVTPLNQDPTQPGVETPGTVGSTTTPIVPDAFLTPELPGRVAINANEPGAPGQLDAQFPGQTTPIVPQAFQNNPARVTIGDELPPTTVGGFVPLTPAPQSSTFLSTQGSFSVVPLVPGVAGPEFTFGGTRVASGVVRTPSPAQVQTPAVPFVATPQPLTAQQPVPLVATPPPLNGQPPVPLIATPPPLNSQPVSATPPGASAPATTQGAGSVPGLVPANPNAGGSPAATTPAVSTPGGAAPSP